MANYEVKGMLGKVLSLLDSNSFIGKMCCACGVAATEEITYKPLGDNVIHMCEYCYGYLSKEVPGCQCAECLEKHSIKTLRINDKICLPNIARGNMHMRLVKWDSINFKPSLGVSDKTELLFTVHNLESIRCNGEH